jgi:heme-degrading monooxygenase HmoA
MRKSPFARTPEPPHYAVILASQQSRNTEGYDAMADKMMRLASEQSGFLGIESVRDDAGTGVTISYWESEKDIANWKANSDHLRAQEMGMEKWYSHYELRITKIDRAYSDPEGRTI